MQKIALSDDNTLTGGFMAIRGGEQSTNTSCDNSGASCSGTNKGGCTNDISCGNTSNSSGTCTNETACAMF